jgi:hypothetical protein
VVPSPPNVTAIETNGLAVRTEQIAAYRGLVIGVLTPVDEHSCGYEHRRDFSPGLSPPHLLPGGARKPVGIRGEFLNCIRVQEKTLASQVAVEHTAR